MRQLLPATMAALLSALQLVPVWAAAQSADADSDEATVEEVVVYGRAQTQLGIAQSASEGIVGFDDIQLPPMLRVGELVEAVPGMVATQHSGTGKANQYFIRGFNLDHGTDFAASVEGVPINMRSHGHGQGYLDLNFLIPELVRTTGYRRGPYASSVGDFSSAASVEFDLYDQLPDNLLSATAGEYGYLRGFAGGSTVTANGVVTGAVDVTRYDGPWDISEDLRQHKFFTALNSDIGGKSLRITAQGYDSEWRSTDQVPRRAIDSGLITPLGSIDDDLGGQTSRYALTGNLSDDNWSLSAFIVDYDFTLFSNFTYFLDDPVNGDEFEQRDKRRIYGLSGRASRDLSSFGRRATLRWGGDIRYDDIEQVGLYETVARVRESTVREDSVDEGSLGVWAEAETALSERLRVVAGLRYDYYDWDVNALRAVNSGTGDDALFSPKLTLAYRFSERLEGYANWGRGFHSNDVRGATIAVDPASGDAVAPVDALIASNGAEVGVRLEDSETFNATLTAFWLELDSELVYVGDAGTTEPNDGSRRVGAELTAFWQANDWLALNAAYTATDARFRTDQGGGREIPGAVPATFTAGINAAWTNGVRLSARLRWLDEAPLVEDNSVRSEDSLLLNAGLALRRGRAEYRLDIFNLLDSGDDDIAYFYASRLANEPGPGTDDIHFHPLEPRALRASVTLYWQ